MIASPDSNAPLGRYVAVAPHHAITVSGRSDDQPYASTWPDDGPDHRTTVHRAGGTARRLLPRPVGGLPRLAPTSPGPSVTAGMSWAVVAYDAASLPMAVGPLGEISP